MLHRRGRTGAFLITIAVVLSFFIVSVTASAATPPPAGPQTPGTRPAVPARAQARTAAPLDATPQGGGLHQVVNERGHLSRSISGATSDDTAGGVDHVQKPANATVRSAFLAVATTGFRNTPLSSPVTIDGTNVPLDNITPTGIGSFNYFTNVTAIVKPKIDAAPAGPVPFLVAEPQPDLTEGEILVVIFDDPSVTVDQTVTVLCGALSPSGDQYSIQLANPISLADPATRLEMSLGISYSYQSNGTQQYSTVDVNDRRLTTAAGGEDDGQSHNGALLTVGGDGDSPANPADPNATPTNPQSDDELYDLRPFVRDGDKTIHVATNNPSLDDNVFLATFTMNPPVTNVSTGSGRFVYLALGDSYQSGEGAGFDIRPSADYRASAYENGSNYSQQVGPQDDTYTSGVSASGDACHRALLNYAKINRDKLKPEADVVLIDRTCSGAKIEPGGKPPVVGAVGGGIDHTSQVQQALDRLQGAGLSAGDVDLVTVGMGGNDAKFGDIVAACVGPSLLSAMLHRYPNGPSEVDFVVDHASCSLIDQFGVHSDSAIAALAAKETFAQQQILATFPKARVLQLDYPNILPVSKSPTYCGGLRGSDVSYTRTRVKKIDDAVRASVQQTANGDSRIELVENEPTFGANALCPGQVASRLANGISQANVDAEVTRLLNLNGNGDATARSKVDALVAAYRSFRSCLANQLNPFSSCSAPQKLKALEDRANDVFTYVGNQQETIFGNLVSAPGTSDDSVAYAFDRSRGLFHPNAAGVVVLACNVLNTYQAAPTNSCASTSAPSTDSVNGVPFGLAPILTQVRQVLQLVIGGFTPNLPVHLRLFSTPMDLGEVTADASGVVRTSVPIPPLNAGVHSLQLEGAGAGGVQVTKQVLLRVPGRPSGEYTTYLCCFKPEPSSIPADAPQEHITITVGGIQIATLIPDEDGGVLVHVPSIDQLINPSNLAIEAKSDLTGVTVRELINPIPTAPSLWATSPSDTAISVVGTGFRAAGRVHSEGGLRMLGTNASLTGGTEYATRLDLIGTGLTITPAASKVAPGQGNPPIPAIADYRPGGAIATSGVPYRAVDPKTCQGGNWTPSPTETLTGVVYVPCAVTLTGTGRTIAATIAAEGTITVTGSNMTIGPSAAGAPSLLSAASGTDAIVLWGLDVTLVGTAYAPAGTLRAVGTRAVLQCGVVSSMISIVGTNVSTPMSSRCLPQ